MKKYKVLIVDDNEFDRIILKKYLSEDFYVTFDIIEAENGHNALKMVQKHCPDCILLDYILPDCNGAEILKSLSVIYPVCPVIMITGQEDTAVAIDLMKLGAQDYFSKLNIDSNGLKKVVFNTINKVSLLNNIIQKDKEIAKERNELKKVNKKLVAAVKKAEDASRFKTLFLGNMSHEIRTPLNGALGMTELLLNTNLTDKQRKYATTIYKSSEILLSLINDILDLSKIEAGELDLESIECTLHEIVNQVYSVNQVLADKNNVELLLDYDSIMGLEFLGDPLRLKQILMNLTSNAIKFANNGTVTIKVTLENETAKTYHLLFEVIDTGIGIPKNKISTIFHKFKQAGAHISRKYGGTGLGLSICKNLVEIMNGKIGVKSQVDKGSTFWFSLKVPKITQMSKKFNHMENDAS